MTQFYRQVKALYEFAESPVKRVRTGIKPVDELIGGPAPGEVCMICGRSYAGKSIFGQNIIYNNPGLPSIFFSLEMPSTQAIIRLYAMSKDFDAVDVQAEVESSKPPADMWDLVKEYPQHWIVDQAGISLDEMSDTLTQFESEHSTRPAFVVVDYLELLGGAKASGEGYLATEAQVTQLKDWAKSEQQRVFVLHQANRSEDRWEPIREDSARNAGYTEADFFIGMWREHFNPKLDWQERQMARSYVTMNVLKNRAFFRESEKDFRVSISNSLRLGRTHDNRQTSGSSQQQSWDNAGTFTSPGTPDNII